MLAAEMKTLTQAARKQQAEDAEAAFRALEAKKEHDYARGVDRAKSDIALRLAEIKAQAATGDSSVLIPIFLLQDSQETSAVDKGYVDTLSEALIKEGFIIKHEFSDAQPSDGCSLTVYSRYLTVSW